MRIRSLYKEDSASQLGQREEEPDITNTTRSDYKPLTTADRIFGVIKTLFLFQPKQSLPSLSSLIVCYMVMAHFSCSAVANSLECVSNNDQLPHVAATPNQLDSKCQVLESARSNLATPVCKHSANHKLKIRKYEDFSASTLAFVLKSAPLQLYVQVLRCSCMCDAFMLI